MIKEKILNNLICIRCSEGVGSKGDKLVCAGCGKEYPIIDNKPQMIDEPAKDFSKPESDFIVSKLKIFFKKFPRVFNIIYYLFGASFVGKSAKEAIKDIAKDKIIVNLGSGPKKIREDVINVDFYPFTNIDIVADIARLPFKNSSIDVVINEFVLEHTKNYQVAINEIKRVLKPDGLIYIAVPFVASFHSSPDDYRRWSKEGLKELMQDFREIESGVRCGPTSAMVSIFNEWLATLLSFGSKYLHQILLLIFTVITSPLKLLDYLISKFPSAQNIAFGFYYIGRKKKI